MYPRKTIKTALTLLLSIMTLISCAPEIPSPIFVDPSYLNKQIKLKIADSLNTYKVNDPIYLDIQYNTDKKIVFPNNYNLRIFTKLDHTVGNEWGEIQEKPTERYPNGEIIFSPATYAPAIEIVPVLPNLPNSLQEYYLRIYVTGNMESDSNIIQVSAYADIKLMP